MKLKDFILDIVFFEPLGTLIIIGMASSFIFTSKKIGIIVFIVGAIILAIREEIIFREIFKKIKRRKTTRRVIKRLNT